MKNKGSNSMHGPHRAAQRLSHNPQVLASVSNATGTQLKSRAANGFFSDESSLNHCWSADHDHCSDVMSNCVKACLLTLLLFYTATPITENNKHYLKWMGKIMSNFPYYHKACWTKCAEQNGKYFSTKKHPNVSLGYNHGQSSTKFAAADIEARGQIVLNYF